MGKTIAEHLVDNASKEGLEKGLENDNLRADQCVPLFRVGLDPDGKRAIDWSFSNGQVRAMESVKRFILVLAGWQSGKSEVGPRGSSLK